MNEQEFLEFVYSLPEKVHPSWLAEVIPLQLTDVFVDASSGDISEAEGQARMGRWVNLAVMYGADHTKIADWVEDATKRACRELTKRRAH